MLRRKQRILCYIFACILLVTSMYATYVKADTIAKHAVVSCTNKQSIDRIQAPDNRLMKESVYATARTGSVIRTAIGQVTRRTALGRRDIRVSMLILCGLIVTCFLLRFFVEDELLCFHQKKYQTALIKYIHDMDGKKRMSCLF